jgi:hypothetical protein
VSGWRRHWLIITVASVLVLAGGGAAVWNAVVFKQVNIVLPAKLLSQARDTGPEAATLERKLEMQARKASHWTLDPKVGFYGNLPGPAFAVLLNAPPCGGDACNLPASSLVVLSLKQAGDAQARAFPLGGGFMVCNSVGSSSRLHCAWIDQVTDGSVFFADGYASSLSDAAAKTMQIRGAIEH